MMEKMWAMFGKALNEGAFAAMVVGIIIVLCLGLSYLITTGLVAVLFWALRELAWYDFQGSVWVAGLVAWVIGAFLRGK